MVAVSLKKKGEGGIERIAADWRAVIADPEVDAVCIGTWPYLHTEASVAALEAGKHVLTEARMAATLPEAREMLRVAEAHPGQVAQVVPSPFTLDMDATVRELLDRKVLGEIREVHVAHATGALLDPAAPLGWRQDPRYSGINLLTLGICHEVILRWLDQQVEVCSVEAETFVKERVHWETGERTPVKVPDCLHLLGRLPGGALARYHISGVEPGPARHAIRLVGSQAGLRADLNTGALFLRSVSGEERPVEIPEGTRRGWRVEADFIESIRTGRPVKLTSFAEGVRYMEFTDAVHQRLPR